MYNKVEGYILNLIIFITGVSCMGKKKKTTHYSGIGGQAVLEGVAFALRDSFEVAKSLGIKIERTKICGGGAKSPLWKKMIANILNLKVDVIESEEGPALGGAMLAAVACGEFESVEAAAAKIVKIIDTVEPDEKLVARYEERYQQFREIYPACKPVFEIIK